MADASLKLVESKYDKLLRSANRGCEHWKKAATRKTAPTEFCPYNISTTCGNCKAYWSLITWQFPQAWVLVKKNHLYTGWRTVVGGRSMSTSSSEMPDPQDVSTHDEGWSEVSEFAHALMIVGWEPWWATCWACVAFKQRCHSTHIGDEHYPPKSWVTFGKRYDPTLELVWGSHSSDKFLDVVAGS